jgi:riboflavin kinase/FMN adenylyltransferase
LEFELRVIQGITSVVKAPFTSSVVTIGNFDGVHLGHQALIHCLIDRAREKNLPSVVITFEPHPLKVLYPGLRFHRIFDYDDQLEQLAKIGIDFLVVEPFSREFSQLSPERFLTEGIFKPFVPECLIVGYDFSFGANREGSLDFLQDHAPRLGFKVEIVPPVKIKDVIVSSTRIRQAVENGDVELAGRLLGRRFYLRGLIERGAGRGRTIGVPTANLRTSAELIPARGVYAGLAKIRGQEIPAAINVGLNPTFLDDDSKIRIEAHLLGFNGDLYGENLLMEFVARLREERKFSTVEALVEQIKLDLNECRKLIDGIASGVRKD